MFKPEHYKEVGTFFLVTTNLEISKYYSLVDFRDVFFAVELTEENNDKTAFTTPYGRFDMEWLSHHVYPLSILIYSQNQAHQL